MNDPIFERFLVPGDRAKAVVELTSRGAAALPILEVLFSGEAKNQFNVSYRACGIALECGLIVASRLGGLAKPLERYLREELHNGTVFAAHAATALGSLGKLEEASIVELAEALDQSGLLWSEAAVALVRSGELENPLVKHKVQSSEKAAGRLRYVASMKIFKQI